MFELKNHIRYIKKIDDLNWSAVFDNQNDLDSCNNLMELYLNSININAVPIWGYRRPVDYKISRFPFYVEFTLN